MKRTRLQHVRHFSFLFVLDVGSVPHLSRFENHIKNMLCCFNNVSMDAQSSKANSKHMFYHHWMPSPKTQAWTPICCKERRINSKNKSCMDGNAYVRHHTKSGKVCPKCACMTCLINWVLLLGGHVHLCRPRPSQLTAWLGGEGDGQGECKTRGGQCCCMCAHLRSV